MLATLSGIESAGDPNLSHVFRNDRRNRIEKIDDAVQRVSGTKSIVLLLLFALV